MTTIEQAIHEVLKNGDAYFDEIFTQNLFYDMLSLEAQIFVNSFTSEEGTLFLKSTLFHFMNFVSYVCVLLTQKFWFLKSYVIPKSSRK